MQRHDIGLNRLPETQPRRKTIVAAVGAGLLVLAAPEAALAASNGCKQINAGVFNQTVSLSGIVSPAPTLTLVFEKGEVINIAYADLDQFAFTVNGTQVFTDISFPITGTTTYTVPANGSRVLVQTLAGLGGRPPVVGSTVFTCTPVPAPPPPPVDPDPDDDDETAMTAAEVDARRRAALSFFTFDLRYNPESMPGSAGEPAEAGDHDHVFAFTASAGGAATPWPLATAYGPEEGAGPVQTLSATSQQRMSLGGIPVNVWARAKGSLYGGTLDLRGGSGQGLLGATVGVTPNLDLGVFGHILGGRVSSAPLQTEVDSLIGGVGAFGVARLPNSFRFGMSVVHGWGSHDIAVAGGTGSFSSSHWTVEGSLARPFSVHRFVFTPMALLTWQQARYGAYTDSNGIGVRATAESSLALAGVLDIAYPISVGGTLVDTVTPRFNVRTNFFTHRTGGYDFGGGFLLDTTAVTVDLTAGLAMGLAGGGNVDVAVAASGLAGNVKSYSLRGNLRLPLN
ncbi:MAG: autotransporter outer membrane beta-barrel domain-containing protein [Rhizobiaceae bacterium]|nr:autotransporter outer membrane beta-barrel domain-containing protein [Rhizobiaceae bacterium]